MEFEMNRTWSEAVRLVKANFQLLALLAGIFLLLPSLVMIVSMPEFAQLITDPAADPEVVNAQLEEVLSGFFVFILLTIAISMVGYGAMVALIGPERPTVGGAIAKAFKAMPTLIASFLVFVVGYLLLALLLGVVGGLLAAALAFVIGEGGATGLMSIVLLVVICYVLTRFSLLLPVVIIDRVANPFTAFVRSWRLTAPARWRIFGFFALLFVTYMIIALLVVLVMGGLSAAAGSGAALILGIVSGLLGVVVGMLFSAILVSMHGQLAGTSDRPVGAAIE